LCNLSVPGTNEKLVTEFKGEMLDMSEMADAGLMSIFLRMEVKQEKKWSLYMLKKDAKEILKKSIAKP